MSTTVARSRARRAATSAGSLETPPATRNTRSAPSPPDTLARACLDRGQTLRRPGRRHSTAPAFSASAQRSATTSRPDHLDPRGDEQADDELADQPQADDTRGVTDLGVALAHTLHGDGSDGGEGGQAGVDRIGHRHAEVRRHPVDLGMEGELVARAGDDLAPENSSAPAPTSTTTPASE